MSFNQHAANARPLSNPNASSEAINLYRYIGRLFGSAMLAGQQESTWINNNPDDEMQYIQQHTGKLPAIRGLDYIAYNGVTERAIAWWLRGGIVSISWHWGAPTLGSGYEASKLSIDIEQALTPGTVLHEAMLADLDTTAAELARLRDANVPVLWRPLHEFDGDWFWWSKGGPDLFKRLWIFMYDRYTNLHRLNNLIWVLGFTARAGARWYPGPQYVDIAGGDIYESGTQSEMFDAVSRIVGNDMPVCYHECGPIPDPSAAFADGAPWSWFLTWHTKHIKEQNRAAYLRDVYNHPLVITLDRLPPLN